MYTTILFDLDDTILDFNKSESMAIEHSFNEYNLYIDEDIKKKYKEINKSMWRLFENGCITKEQLSVMRFDELFKQLEIDINTSEFNKTYQKNLSITDFVMDGAKEMLEELQLVYDMHIVTNGVSFVQKGRILKTNMKKYFKHIFISEDIGTGKPDKKYFDCVFNNISEKVLSKILIVGDSLTSDIRGGINSKIDTCWFNPDKNINETEIKPTFTVYNIEDMKKLLLGLRG